MADRDAQGGGEKMGPRDAIGDSATQPAPAALDISRLIVDHHENLFRYAYRLTGSTPDAEDLTQQTFLMAQQRLGQVRDPARIGGWLYSVLRSCFLKSRRKRRPVLAANLELEIDELPETPADEPIDRQQLQAALDELPDDARLILAMFYFEDCSYKEIADQLQIAIGTVMSRLARAKARLRGSLLKHTPVADRDAPWTRTHGHTPAAVSKITSQRIPLRAGPPGNAHAT